MQSASGLSLIVAMTPERVIGKDNALPWRIPSDLRRFKDITTGHPVIMGRKNWESIPLKFRPLPGRTNIVLTRQPGYATHGGVVVGSIEDARAIAFQSPGAEEVFVIGGEEIYRAFLPQMQKAYVTLIDAFVAGDVHFPEMPSSEWLLVSETETKKWNENDQHPYSFRIYERR